MVQGTNTVVPRPTIWRSAMVVGVFVAVGGGVALLLGEASLVPVFAALGVVTAFGEWKRWKQAMARGEAAPG